MIKYFIKRILWIIPVILGVAVLIFTIMYFTPGDPVSLILGSGATEEERAILTAALGLDKPYIVQLLMFLRDTFLRADFGVSYVYKTAVFQGIVSRMKYTLILGLLGMCMQVFVGTPLGIYAATHHDKLGDRVSMFASLVGVSMPQFWFAIILVLFFAVQLNLLPATGVDHWYSWILPVIANSMGGIATQARQTRSSMLEVINSDYITTARAKGLNERKVIYKHALPNALIPLVTILGNGFGICLGGAVIIERVFTIPGIGTYMTNAIGSRDYPVVRGCVVFLAIAFSVIMLCVDLVYAVIDPRIKARYEKQGAKKRGKSNG